MISYTRTHILSTVSSVSCCVVAYVATEPETVFTDDFFTRNLMCSMQAKLPVFGSHLKGKMPANAIALGPRIRTFAKSPQKGPHQTVAALERHWSQWILRRDFLAGFLGISSDFADAVDVRRRLRTLLDGGPCSHRIHV